MWHIQMHPPLQPRKAGAVVGIQRNDFPVQNGGTLFQRIAQRMQLGYRRVISNWFRLMIRRCDPSQKVIAHAVPFEFKCVVVLICWKFRRHRQHRHNAVRHRVN